MNQTINQENKNSLFCLDKVTEEDLEKMLNAQYELNVKTAGNLWTKGITAEGRGIFWNRCMMMEAAELIDSFPWKHWKDLNAQGDVLNAKIEIVDIWHFLMSFIIEQLVKDAYLHSEIEENFDELNEKQLRSLWNSRFVKNRIQKILPELNNAMVLQQAFGGLEDRYKNYVDNIAYDAENFMEVCNVAGKMQLSVDDEEEYDGFQSCISVMLAFVIMSRHFDLDLKEAYEVKNVLNEFRQLHGYKEGKYVKKWNYEGKELEDNKVAFDRIAKGVLAKDLLQDLEQFYDARTKS